jgi:capsular polysaccharide biosynthesis protein
VSWRDYWAIIARRWAIVLIVLVLDVLFSGYQAVKSYRSVGYQSCLTLYVADVSSPSLIAAPPTSLQAAGQLLAGETAANFFADDILDVARSRSVADWVSGQIRSRALPTTAPGDITVGGSRLDRTVNLCVTNPNEASAQAAATALGTALTTERARFVGKPMAHRTYVQVISPPESGRAPASRSLLNLALRLILGLAVAVGLAFLWDALDPNVRGRQDAEAALGVPVLAGMD